MGADQEEMSAYAGGETPPLRKSNIHIGKRPPKGGLFLETVKTRSSKRNLPPPLGEVAERSEVGEGKCGRFLPV